MSTIPDIPGETPSPRHPNAVISEYLANHIPEYRELGWSNPAADEHFAQERQNADKPTAKAKDNFYRMTCAIGHELNTTTGGALIIPPSSHPPAILDLCLAPGGFSTTALALNPTATLHGLTLPSSLGGYDVRIPRWRTHPRIAAIHFLDVTMLTSEMDLSFPIPDTHPDAGRFITTNPLPRLLRQLVLAMGRIKEGGTLVVVMHRADAWGTARVVETIRGFSERVQLFKPARAHARKGSFYLVARGVMPGEAGEAVEWWRELWRMATFGRGVGEGREGDQGVGDGDDGGAEGEYEEGDDAKALLEAFGEELVRLTAPVFKIQAQALRTAPYVGK
ncbi:hypothetical protein C8A05DRAFT_46772 [Staphylotrichum tortipilum]|uniref:Ribosomal RNA methyltransferase FtsJ domain-containing protein n=1 Tax=Staphylotrichum tortipilum TaxID=2831512 RepID=A0AAN6RQT4_9PEZI|nr:hypothetical protein C8A05DRAFT_46772 [Staphylotrichum longicolle]